MLDEYDLSSLRAERRRLSDRHEHLTWLRRLVKARGDLEVARLTGLCASSPDDLPLPLPERVREAIALQPSGAGANLLHDLVASLHLLDDAADSAHEELAKAQAELVRRYRSDPASCLGAPLVEAGQAAV